MHTQAQQPHHLSCCPADTGTALLFHDLLPVGWGGVGWRNNFHVPVHTQAQQPHHLSCCPADTGTALLFHGQLPVGWGGVRWGGVGHRNLIIFLAVLQTQALHCSFMISYRWGGVITFMFLCTHKKLAKRSCYVVTSSVSNLPNVPDTL